MTFAERLAAHFRAHAGEWLDGRELATIGGVYAWRSRCSDLRKQYGMQIENRLRKVGRVTVSEYKFVPKEQQQSLGL